MPPFGYAVCLVNGKKRDGNVFQYIQEIRHGKTFRRYVEQFYLITLQDSVKVRHFLIIQRTIHISRGYSVCPRSVNLVFHQRDKRADDNSGAAAYMNSSLNDQEVSDLYRILKGNKIELLYIAPERFAKPNFLDILKDIPISLFAIDEAHCISEWGHDFRPDYLSLSVIPKMFPNAPIAAF